MAGRCAAGDKVSHAAIRNQMCCAVPGQGAGVAAAVSLKEGVTSGRVDVRRVQDALKAQGVRLSEPSRRRARRACFCLLQGLTGLADLLGFLQFA